MKTRVQLFKSKSGWRWRMRDYKNGKTIAASSEGYKRRVDAIKNLARISSATEWCSFRLYNSRGDIETVTGA